MPDYTLKTFADVGGMSAFAAEQLAQAAARALAERGRVLVALSGGSTPLALFALLAQPPFKERLPWEAMHIFWADERCVPPQDAESNYGQAERTLFRHVPLPPGNIHRVQGELEPPQAAEAYVEELQKFSEGGLAWPRFDLVLLGMGADGHTASLFPGSLPAEEQAAPAIAVTGSYQGRPAERVTLTPMVFNSARAVLFLVSGEEKAEALKAVLSGPGDPLRWPARRVHPLDGTVTWIVDTAAARGLTVS